MRILIADDDLHLRRGIADLLALEGFETVVAEDGVAAWEAFRNQRPEFCILDVMMPRMNGFELCRAIRREDAQCPSSC